MSAWTELALRLQPHAARLGEALGRLAYPPHCVVCARPLDEDDDRYLCRECIRDVPFVRDPTCPRCGHELGPHQTARPRCAVCRNIPLRFHRAVAAAHHSGSARQMVLALKFARRKHHAYPLGKLLAARLNDTDIPEKIQFLVPVPLHRSRLRSRGFNQAGLLARELGEMLRLPVSIGNLYRRVNTPPQTAHATPAQRRANVKGAFALRWPHRVRGKTLLLVDDVLTTGATTAECAGVLRRAGAKRVYVATATRRMLTPPRDDAPPEPLAADEVTSLAPPPEERGAAEVTPAPRG